MSRTYMHHQKKHASSGVKPDPKFSQESEPLIELTMSGGVNIRRDPQNKQHYYSDCVR